MRFGLLYEMEMPRPWNERSEYDIYWQALEQIELGDRLGFDLYGRSSITSWRNIRIVPRPRCSLARSASAPKIFASRMAFGCCPSSSTIP